ncbi:MAG: VOC family protein [Gammaproteobacteria bacterium]|nr:VOC family protein [Gammaproteobacteria bacterium]
MSAEVKPIPEGYHSITPYLIVKGAAGALDFYKQVFGATEIMRMADGDRIGHAEITIGDSHVMVADEYPDMGYFAPESGRAPPVGLMLYVEDVDGVVERAVAAGATLDRPVEDQFYGDRAGDITDPFGHRWHISTHVEDVPPEEMEERMEKAQQGQ